MWDPIEALGSRHSKVDFTNVTRAITLSWFRTSLNPVILDKYSRVYYATGMRYVSINILYKLMCYLLVGGEGGVLDGSRLESRYFKSIVVCNDTFIILKLCIILGYITNIQINYFPLMLCLGLYWSCENMTS